MAKKYPAHYTMLGPVLGRVGKPVKHSFETSHLLPQILCLSAQCAIQSPSKDRCLLLAQTCFHLRVGFMAAHEFWLKMFVLHIFETLRFVLYFYSLLSNVSII